MTEALQIRNLETELQLLVRAQGSPSRVSVREVHGADSIGAHINLSTEEIEYQIPSDWDPIQYKRIKKFSQGLGLRDPRKKICNDVVFHEVGHRKLRNDETGLGCPEDLEGKELAIDAVSKAMIEAGRFSQQGAPYLENMISDIINNLNCSRYTRYNGLSMFFAEQGEIIGGSYSPLYEAFVKLNMHLFGTKKQKKLVGAYHTNNKEVDEVVRDCIKDMGLTGTRDRNIGILFNKSQWSQTYYTLARHLVKLMDQNAPEFLPGSGSGGKGYRVPAQFEGEPKFNPDDVDDPVLRRVFDKDNMKKVMQRRNKAGEDIPSFVENWRALDYFYLGEASELIIKAEMPKKGEKIPFAPIQARTFDVDKDSLDDILFGRILFDENGQPVLAVPRSYIEHEVRYKRSLTSYPELNIAVLDTSISMTEAANQKGQGNTNIVPWGDNSKYHYALLTYYGIEKALHRMGVGTKTRYNMVTFSSKTEATGKKDYEGRADIKKRILQPTFGGNTKLDTGILSKQAREKGSVLMTISDGEIWNWSDIRDDMKRIISDKFYVHFQIGADTETTQDLESWGATVVRISDAAQMPKKGIDIAQKFYTSYTASELR